MKLLIANWKASINKPNAAEWMTTFLNFIDSNTIDTTLQEKDTTVVICPPFPLISLVAEQCSAYERIKVGSQTVSTMPNGAYTGEVTAELLKDYVNYSIIGHSERRQFFNLNEEEIAKQINESITHNMIPILCVRSQHDAYYDNVNIVAYEPIDAIGSGHNANVNDVLEMKKNLGLTEKTAFIYGGSVDAENVSSYLQTGEIDGFLIGTASLHADSFIKLVEAMI
jgi:triosephosphate isomerase